MTDAQRAARYVERMKDAGFRRAYFFVPAAAADEDIAMVQEAIDDLICK